MVPVGPTQDVTTSGAASASPQPFRRLWLVLAGGVLTGVAVAWLSKDVCFVTSGSLIMAAVAVWGIDAFILPSLAHRKRWCRQAQITLVAAVVASLSLWLKVDEKVLFEQTVGMAPPEGVRELVCDSALMAPIGDQVILLRFSADEETIAAIVDHRGFVRDDEIMEYWKRTSPAWPDLWDKLLGGAPWGGKAWKEPDPMANPVLFRWRNESNTIEVTTLLWDADSQRVYVFYSFG